MSQSPDIDLQAHEPDADPGEGASDAAPSGTQAGDDSSPADEPVADAPVDDAAAEESDAAAEDAEDGEGAEDDEDADDDDAAESVDGEGNSEGAGSGRKVMTVARLEREGEIAADFLEKLLDIADLDGDLDVDVEGERASVAIVDSADGRVPRRLVGQNGEVLEALQELSRLAVQARTGDRSRLMLDVAGHRARRREQLVAHAQEAAAKVKESGEPLRLEPMNPFERKIVHDAVAAAGLQSASEGVEPDRRIVVSPA